MLSAACPGVGQAESKHPYSCSDARVIKGPFDSRQNPPLAQGDRSCFVDSLRCVSVAIL